MKFATFCFIILQQLTFEIIKAQLFSWDLSHGQFNLPKEKLTNLHSLHQHENVSPTNENIISVYDKEFKPYRSKDDINPSFHNVQQKYSQHTPNTWNQNVPINDVNQIPYLIYHSGNEPLKNTNNNYLPGIIVKAGNAVKETADENHKVFKNSIDSLVAAGVANTNAGKDLIQSGLTFGTSFSRFGSKLFGHSNVSHQKNGFDIGRFPFK